jgi:potassium-transporting ATPase potassium-binding subunit
VNGAFWLQMGVYWVVLLSLAKPLGEVVAQIASNRKDMRIPLLGRFESGLYRIGGIRPMEEMTWKEYAQAFLVFQLVGILVLFGLERLQGVLPLDPAHLGPMRIDSALNAAISFVTNTNWQCAAGEATASDLTQMLGYTVQNFVSAAGGIAVLLALGRGFARHGTRHIGNFWVDLVRVTLYILLPLSFVLALLLTSQGVVQTFGGPVRVETLERTVDAHAGGPASQTLALGPAASQIAIKQLGTNGGGFFNANSAHPFENPTPLTNFLELLAILLLPVALCTTFGRLVGDPRQGRSLLVAMVVLVVPMMLVAHSAEQSGNPLLASTDIDARPSELQSGGNMEGKEVRFGIAGSALWAAATTATSNGSVNSMHDSYTPLGGLVPLWLMQIGEVAFGGVGSGVYGMIVFVIVTVFLAGLMVGRTPEYLGKKIESFEVQMAALVILAPCFAVLVGTAVAVALPAGRAGILNPGPHGFSEVLYAYTSAGNNNGSAFVGLGADTPYYNTTLALAMLLGRYLVAVPVLAIAGSVARKKRVPAGSGTLPTHGLLFIGMLVAVVVVVGALTFLPALALGPVAEQLLTTP